MFAGVAGEGKPIAAHNAARPPGGHLIDKLNVVTAKAPKAGAPIVCRKTAAVTEKIRVPLKIWMINLPHRGHPGICRFLRMQKTYRFYLTNTGIVIFAADGGSS